MSDTQGFEAVPPDYTEETGIMLRSTVDQTVVVAYRFPRPLRFSADHPYAVYVQEDDGRLTGGHGIYRDISAACGAGRAIARERVNELAEAGEDLGAALRALADTLGAPIIDRDAQSYARIRDWGEREGLRAPRTYTIPSHGTQCVSCGAVVDGTAHHIVRGIGVACEGCRTVVFGELESYTIPAHELESWTTKESDRVTAGPPKECTACGADVSRTGFWRRRGHALCTACHDANPIVMSLPPETR